MIATYTDTLESSPEVTFYGITLGEIITGFVNLDSNFRA